MQKRIIALIGTGLAMAAQQVSAQNPNASQVVQNNEQRRQFDSSVSGTNAPELYAGESTDLGPQTVVNMHPHRWHLEAAFDEQMYFTDNMFLDSTLNKSADVNVSTLQVALDAPQRKLLGGELIPRVGIQFQWFNYGLFDNAHIQVLNVQNGQVNPPYQASLDSFDFNAQTYFGDVTWTRNNWLVIFGFNFQRLADNYNYDEFYREYTPNLTVEKTFPLCSRLSASLGYQTDIRYTITKNPPGPLSQHPQGDDLNNRSDQAVYGLVNYKLCNHAILQPYYRFQFSYYSGQRRDDYLNSCGLNLLLPINQNISLRAYYSYTWLDTDGQFSTSYKEMEGGLGLSLAVRF